MMELKYYQAGQQSMLGWRDDPLPCSFCGQVGPGFQIKYDVEWDEDEWDEDDDQAHVLAGSGFFLGATEQAAGLTPIPGRPGDRRDPDFFLWGCMSCLRLGRFTVWHDTDAGEIGKGGLLEQNAYSRAFAPEAAQELSRTPSFSTFQQAIWLTHCSDFMVYLGEWGQDQFNASAGDGNGRAVFVAVAQDAGTRAEEWDNLREYGLYLFRCSHCGKMRSFSDWD